MAEMRKFVLARPKRLADGAVELRPWRTGDAASLVARIDDPAIMHFLDRLPQPYGLADALEYIAGSARGWREATTTNFAIFVDGLDGAVGSIGVHWLEHEEGVAEVGYWIGAEARGRGVATSAVRLATRWAFEAAPWLERIQLRADVENVPSNRVAEKAGFTREGVLRSARRNERVGRRVDFAIWSLLRDEVPQE